MNRTLQRRNVRRFSARKHGGGYGMGAPLVQIPAQPGGDWTFAVKEPVNQGYDDCAFPARPGELFNQPNPALAQVPMVGGGASATTAHSPFYINKEWPTGPVDYTYKTDPSRAQVAMAGGGATATPDHSPFYINKEWSQVAHDSGNPATKWGDVEQAQVAMVGGRKKRRAMKKRRTTKRKVGGGSCGCNGSKLFGGGSKKRRSTRKVGGGTYGYAVDPSVSVGGSGPNVAPLHTGVPCDGRAGAPDALNPPPGPADPRAPADLYSLTTNHTLPSVQAGGGLVSETPAPAMVGSQPSPSAYAHGNAYGPDCYKAPGSELPVYPADVAGFHFRPSTEIGSTLPDGVTAYNDVVPVAARVGGGRKKRRTTHRRRSIKRRVTSRKH